MSAEFNTRARRARISAGWSHATEHYSFMREHKSRAPFVGDQKASHVADAILGVLALAALLGVLLLISEY